MQQYTIIQLVIATAKHSTQTKVTDNMFFAEEEFNLIQFCVSLKKKGSYKIFGIHF